MDLGRHLQEYEPRTTNLTDRQYIVLPLIVAVLVGVASLIWITMVSVLPGAWNFHNFHNFNSRAFPLDVSSIPSIKRFNNIVEPLYFSSTSTLYRIYQTYILLNKRYYVATKCLFDIFQQVLICLLIKFGWFEWNWCCFVCDGFFC